MRCYDTLLLLACLCISACPTAPNNPAGSTGAAGGATAVKPVQPRAAEPAPQPVVWPTAALDYITASISAPLKEDHAALGTACLIVARFPDAAQDPAFGAVRAAVQQCRQPFGDKLPSEVVAAWLATDPQPAQAHVVAKLHAGDDAVLKALLYQPQHGRTLLLNRVQSAQAGKTLPFTDAQGGRILDLLRAWKDVSAADLPLLQALMQLGPVVSYRALGYLLKLQPDDEQAFQKLDAALRTATGKELTAAVEGAKIAQDERFASALTGLAAVAKLGPERTQQSTEAAKSKDAKSGKAQDKTKPQQQRGEQLSTVLGAYGLTYLSCEQAQLARTKLLEAEEPLLRWQARLGELLHGNPQPWRDAIRQQGIELREMWIALEPPEVMAPELLETYAKAAGSKTPEFRARTAIHLNRYAAAESKQQVLQLLQQLVRDENPDVAQACWYTLGELALRPDGADPLTVIADSQATPELKLAAAYCALRWAQAGR